MKDDTVKPVTRHRFGADLNDDSWQVMPRDRVNLMEQMKSVLNFLMHRSRLCFVTGDTSDRFYCKWGSCSEGLLPS